MPLGILKSYWYCEMARSTGPEPVTGPGEVERDKKGEALRELMGSLAPSNIKAIGGDGGLLVADDGLLPELLFAASSVALSAWGIVWIEGVVAVGGEPFPVGVPNWMLISIHLRPSYRSVEVGNVQSKTSGSTRCILQTEGRASPATRFQEREHQWCEPW
jgi:hypothetical protein